MLSIEFVVSERENVGLSAVRDGLWFGAEYWSTCVLGGKYAGKRIRQAEIIASFQLLVSAGILFDYRDFDAN
jgi:hypothetical protein